MSATMLFRADASPSIGAGHVMRSLAFAETLQWAGWSCTFAVNESALSSAPILTASGHSIRVVADEDAAVALAGEARTVVVDHYSLDAGFEQRMKTAGAHLIVFDDLADRPHDCDILLDSSPQRVAEDYEGKVLPECRLLLGARYALVRRTWRQHAAVSRARHAKGNEVRRIIISMGATDPSNATLRVIRGIASLSMNVAVDIVLGAAAPHRDEVAAALAPHMRLHVNPENLIDLFVHADLAIGAPGSTSFERAVLGLPSILIPSADNQRFIAQAFGATGASEVLPADTLDRPADFATLVQFLAADGNRRAAMSQAAAQVTDGRGALRLLAAAAGSFAASDGSQIQLRLAETDDERWLLELQSQPGTRRHALNPVLPTADEHKQWLRCTLDDPERLLAIVVASGEPVGMVRLDRVSMKPVTFQISIAVDERKYSRGIGRAALELARALAPAAEFLATVLPENQASLALFAAAGYRAEGDNRYRSRAA